MIKHRWLFAFGVYAISTGLAFATPNADSFSPINFLSTMVNIALGALFIGLSIKEQ